MVVVGHRRNKKIHQGIFCCVSKIKTRKHRFNTKNGACHAAEDACRAAYANDDDDVPPGYFRAAG